MHRDHGLLLHHTLVLSCDISNNAKLGSLDKEAL